MSTALRAHKSRTRESVRRIRILAALTGVVGLVGLVVGSPREARADAAQLDRLEPSERGSQFFVVDSLELDGRLRGAAGLVTTYAHALRAYGTPAEGAQTTLVEDQVVLHPGGTIVMAPGARIGVDLPVALQRGELVNLAGQAYQAPASPALGDLRVSFDLKLAGPEREGGDGLTVAGGAATYLPTGSRDDYMSDGYTRVGVRLAGAFRQGPVIAALRVGLMYRRELEDFGRLRMGSEANTALGVGVRAGGFVVGPEVAASTILRDQAFAHPATPVDGLLGAHGVFGDVTLGFGGGTALVRGIGSASLRLFASVEWAPRGKAPGDRDGDGVPDPDDVCPDVPGARGGPPEARGCPEAPRDGDRDGIVDGDDACPDLPGIRTRDPMTNGCPDSDHDGIPDPVDACPTVSGERSPVPRYNGCPPDADGDDVPDLQDACPDRAGVKTDDPETNGCPPPPPPPADRDKDGVVDPDDACPDEPGLRTTVAATNGCPLVRRDGDRLVLANGIAFTGGTGPVAIAPGDPVLTALAAWLHDHPDAARLRVESHGDGSGDKKKSLRATQAEAQAVVDRLAALGVAKKRLEARGVGNANPIAPTDTAEGRAQNRRIELRVLPR